MFLSDSFVPPLAILRAAGNTAPVTLGYIAAIALCFWAGWLRRRATGATPTSAGPRNFQVATVFLAGVFLARRTPWPEELVDVFRHFARVEGWYEQRHSLQAAAALVIGLLVAWSLAFALRQRARLPLRDRLLAAGLGTLVVYLGVHALSFHAIDEALSVPIIGLTLGRWIEGGAVALAGLAAIVPPPSDCRD